MPKMVLYLFFFLFVCLNSNFYCTKTLFFKFFFLTLPPQTESPRCKGGEGCYMYKSVYECRFDLLQTSQPWIESDYKTESSGQKARVNTTSDMIEYVTSLFSYNVRVVLSYRCGCSHCFCPDQKR